NDRLAQFVVDHAPAPVDLHQRGHRQAVNLRIERADARRQPFGQHRDRALGKIDRRAAQSRLVVERRALAHVKTHVGDVNAEQKISVVEPLQTDRVVEIARGLAVNRHCRLTAQLQPPRDLIFSDDGRNFFGLFDHFVREDVRQIVFVDYDLNVHSGRVARSAEPLDDSPRRVAARDGIARDLDEHDPSVIRLGGPLGGQVGRGFSFDLDIELELFIQRFDPRLAEAVTQPADDPQTSAPQNHLDFPITIALTRRDAGEHEIAIERAVQVFGFDANAPADTLFDFIRNKIDHFAAALADHADHRFLRTGEAEYLTIAAQQTHALQTVEQLFERFLPRAVEFEHL